jgi:SAM-dependent methyltransferase
MLLLGRWLFPATDSVLVRGIAESLPFRDAAFDRIVCQGSLDHFVAPDDFMRETARLLRPGGRVVIALANYDSLSCRLGRAAYRFGRRARLPVAQHRQYWEIPPDHFHRGDLRFVRQLGGSHLQLERCYGLSMMWLCYSWGKFVDWLPDRVADRLLHRLQGLAHARPSLADMIVSVWRPRGDGGRP